MAIFRRRIGERVWHWSPSCSGWPGEGEAVLLPPDEYPELLCPLCRQAREVGCILFRQPWEQKEVAMRRGEPSAQGTAQPNIDTRNVAGAGEAPRFVGPPCAESDCRCDGWTDAGSGVCGSVNPATGKKCGHPLALHR